jgi:hypothetical protein
MATDSKALLSGIKGMDRIVHQQSPKSWIVSHASPSSLLNLFDRLREVYLERKK